MSSMTKKQKIQFGFKQTNRQNYNSKRKPKEFTESSEDFVRFSQMNKKRSRE